MSDNLLIEISFVLIEQSWTNLCCFGQLMEAWFISESAFGKELAIRVKRISSIAVEEVEEDEESEEYLTLAQRRMVRVDKRRRGKSLRAQMRPSFTFKECLSPIEPPIAEGLNRKLSVTMIAPKT